MFKSAFVKPIRLARLTSLVDLNRCQDKGACLTASCVRHIEAYLIFLMLYGRTRVVQSQR